MTVAQATSILQAGRERPRATCHGRRRAALLLGAAAHDRVRLSLRLRRVLTDSPRASHFTVQQIIAALGPDPAPSVALFAAAEVLAAPDAAALSGAVTSATGAKLALGQGSVHLPRTLMRRRIPRASLALLIHAIASLLEKADGVLRERWSWMFHPLMTGTLGVILFLLGLASMAPIVGGGVQHAAAAFFMAAAIAERDGLAVMLGALAGIACLAVAMLSISSGHRLWARIKAWLLQCARRLRLNALARMLDHCCEGLGELLRMRWSGLLLVIVSQDTAAPARAGGPPSSTLHRRALRSRLAAGRVF